MIKTESLGGSPPTFQSLPVSHPFLLGNPETGSSLALWPSGSYPSPPLLSSQAILPSILRKAQFLLQSFINWWWTRYRQNRVAPLRKRGVHIRVEVVGSCVGESDTSNRPTPSVVTHILRSGDCQGSGCPNIRHWQWEIAKGCLLPWSFRWIIPHLQPRSAPH